MAFTLKQTKQFADDLSYFREIPEVAEKLTKLFAMLEEDPEKYQRSLHNEKLKRDKRLWKSRIDQSYRLLWAYGLNKGEIILARIGEHDFIDDDAVMPDMDSLTPLVQRMQPATSTQVSRQGVKHYSTVIDTVFGRVPDNVLRLLGVPKQLVNSIKSLREINDLFDVGLPDQAATILMELYTLPNATIGDLLLSPKVLYRATSDQLESYCKGELKQLLLDLTPEQVRLVDFKANGPTLIKGVAGSGKTTVGIRRAMQDAERKTGLFRSQNTRVMFTTFTETLAKSVKQMFVEQYGETRANQVDVHVLRNWMHAFVGSAALGKSTQFDNCLANAIFKVKKSDPESIIFKIKNFPSFLSTEINDVIKGRNLKTWDDYAQASRVGRGIALQKSARRVLWSVYVNYMEELEKKGICDYMDIAVAAADKLEAEPLKEPFDIVIVDESQDLRPVELNVVMRMCRNPQKSGLILLADAAQSIYYRGISWKDAGVNVVGRTHLLQRNFRNTKQILEAAWSLVKNESELPEYLSEELIEPSKTNKTGPLPVVWLRQGITDQQDAIVEGILRLCEEMKVRPGDIAVLAPTILLLGEYFTLVGWDGNRRSSRENRWKSGAKQVASCCVKDN